MRLHVKRFNHKGFSFIEVAIALLLIALLSSVGMMVLTKSTQSQQRTKTLQQLKALKEGLRLFTQQRGYLPSPTSTAPYWYALIAESPVDAWGQKIDYKVAAAASDNFYPSNPSNPALLPASKLACRELKNITTPSPPTPPPLPAHPAWFLTYNDGVDALVPAVFVSGGAQDLGGPVGLLDGTNDNGPFIRSAPTDSYDDLVVAFTAKDYYEALVAGKFCSYDVTIRNSSVTEQVYVFNVTKGKTIGLVGTATPAGVNPPIPTQLIVSVELDNEIQLRTSDLITPLTSTPTTTPTPYKVEANTTFTTPAP